MPEPGMRWRHTGINTRGTSLHGDERGFRSRKHRIHSSGDYRNPPPKFEHLGLRKYHRQRCGNEVHLSKDLRPLVGRAIIEYFNRENLRLLALAVGKEGF